MKITLAILLSALVAVPCLLRAEPEKVQLEMPKPADLFAELKDAPDGVLRIKTNTDGSFRSLVVKSSVEIESVLGAQKGKQMARKKAETECKRKLSQWMSENCVFAEASNNTTTIKTKGEGTTDAAGNEVVIRNQSATDIQMTSESAASFSQHVLRGLTVISSEVTNDGKEFVLIMALTQKGMDESAKVSDALNKKPTKASDSDKESGSSKKSNKLTDEHKVNAAALEDL